MRIKLAEHDVYAATSGGVRVTEPAADLAVALAVGSARLDEPLPPDVVAIGEVGLSGDVRPVAGVERRLAEARRLGFTRALVPVGQGGSAPAGMQVVEVADVAGALAAVSRMPQLPAPPAPPPVPAPPALRAVRGTAGHASGPARDRPRSGPRPLAP